MGKHKKEKKPEKEKDKDKKKQADKKKDKKSDKKKDRESKSSSSTSSAKSAKTSASSTTAANSKQARKESKKVSKKESKKSSKKAASEHKKKDSKHKKSTSKDSKKKEKHSKKEKSSKKGSTKVYDDGPSGANFEINQESIGPASPEEMAENDRQIEKIVQLLVGVRVEMVTQTTKEDLDRVQTMVKNISYREAGEEGRLRPVSFTEKQKAVIWKITGASADGRPEEGDADDEDESKGTSKDGPKITVPYEKLILVPTRASTGKKK